MKTIINKENVLCIVLLLLYVTQTVVAAVCTVLDWYIILLDQFLSLASILNVRYPYSIALYFNRRNSRWKRQYSDDIDETPTDFAVFSKRAGGYSMLLLIAVSFLINGILQA